MGKHRERRRLKPERSLLSLRTALNVAVPVVLLVVIGMLAFLTTGPRPASAPETAPTPAPPIRSTAPTTAATEAPGNGLDDARRRAASNLAAKAARQPTVRSKRVPRAIPRGLERVDPQTLQSTSFVVSTFNVLGYGHTAPGGNRKGWANGNARMTWATSLLRANSVSVAGLQEFQAPQFRTFQRLAGGEYAVYPGLTMGPAPVQNSIVWRRSDWDLVKAMTTPIPYFRGNRIAMPQVLLRHRQTGQEVWFGNFHNPADARGPAQRLRNAAVAIEAGLVRRLTSDGTPMVVTGDMNDREEYLCLAGRLAGLRSADGGYVDGSGCRTPSRMNVDWVMGTAQIQFSGFVADRSALVQRTTDHPMVRATATVPPARDPARCVRVASRGGAVYCPAA